MNHSRMNLLFKVEERNTPPHDLADVAEVWTQHGKVWGQIVTQSGREYRESDQMHSQAKQVIYSQYYPAAKPQMRLSAENRTFEVESVYPMNGQYMRTQWNVIEVTP